MTPQFLRFWHCLPPCVYLPRCKKNTDSRLKNTVWGPYHHFLWPVSNTQPSDCNDLFEQHVNHIARSIISVIKRLFIECQSVNSSLMSLIPTIPVSFLSYSHNERKVTCKHPVTGVPSQDNCIFVVNEQWVTSFSPSVLHSFLQHWVRNRALCLRFTQKSHSWRLMYFFSSVIYQ